ncbi:MAG TPA: FixH family protein [Beijerinckiaceae bacterium]|nr:FixH family protein [Beijerinckiaceae bacterium]
MTQAVSLSSRRLTGWHVLAILLTFFGTIAMADAVLIYSAVRSWTGAETTSAYRAGQLYNGERAQAQTQAALGWQVDARAERRPDDTVQVSVAARDQGGRPLTGVTWGAVLQRPTSQRDDRVVALRQGAYAQVAIISDLAPGQWDLVVEGSRGGERAYRSKTRLVLR